MARYLIALCKGKAVEKSKISRLDTYKIGRLSGVEPRYPQSAFEVYKKNNAAVFARILDFFRR